MKKYTWSFFNIFEATPKEVIAMQNKFKAFAGIAIASTFISSNEKYSLITALAAFLINEAIGAIRIIRK